jgi:hypothetical protein
MAAASLWVIGCQAASMTGAKEGQSSDQSGDSSRDRGTGGSGGSGSGGAGDMAPACKQDPLHFCPDGIAGRWCVEQPFGDGTLVLQAVWSDRPDDAWIVGFDIGVAPQRTFLAARWDGCQWTSYPNPEPERFSGPDAVWGSGPNDVWIAGAGDRAIHFDGKTLTSAPIGDASTIILGLSGSGPNDVWAAGVGLFHWDGNAWTPVSVPGKNPTDSFPDVWVAGQNDVWTIDLTDALHFDGKTWSALRLTDPQGIFALNTIFATRKEVFAAAIDDDVFWHIENGITTEVRGPRNSGFADLGGAPDGSDVLAASISQDGLLFFDGKGFVPVVDAPAMFYGGVWVSSTQVWAAGASGTVIRRPHAQLTPLPNR